MPDSQYSPISEFIIDYTEAIYDYDHHMIKSFSTRVSEKIFLGEALTKKERKSLGELDLEKSKRRLEMLDEATEKDLLLLPSMKYQHLKGSDRYSVDADKRNSPWRITFSWENEEMKDVEFVKIEDTH